MRNAIALSLFLLGAGSAPAYALDRPVAIHSFSTLASVPDRGSLLAYSTTTALTKGASTWHEVQLSEQHARNAIARGGMVIAAPDGSPIRLQYLRSIQHADGIWSWVGRSASGDTAILTFGPRAVFGTIPNGHKLPLELTSAKGRAFIVQTDQAKLAASGASIGGDTTGAADQFTTASAPPPPGDVPPVTTAGGSTTKSRAAEVDLVLGFTTGFATRLGGISQAVTRLNFLVDLTNQAYIDSKVNGQLLLVRAVQVNYPDNALNRSTLYNLSGVTCNSTTAAGQHYLPDTGVNCTVATRLAALQPLIAARDAVGADLVSLVHNYVSPDNQTCGVAWLLGGGQTAIGAASAAFGFSVVSDSGGSTYPSNGNTCRNETLAHEIGHNLGVAHDRATAAGIDDSNTDGNALDPEEYGRFSYSFGYKTDVAGGNFYDIMAAPSAGQTAYRVFSNPRITVCGGQPCGVAGQADAAQTLNATMPLVENFRAPPATIRTPRQTPGG